MKNHVNLVLLVDDNHLTNTLNERTLLDTGMVSEVVTAPGADEALTYLQRRLKLRLPQPDLIFLDILMPGYNGWEFLEHYRTMLGTIKQNSVVMLTSSPDVSHLLECTIHPEIQDFVIKPLTDVETSRIISQHAQLSRYENASG